MWQPSAYRRFGYSTSFHPLFTCLIHPFLAVNFA
nr:MAG TPA: hypothetical protein [Caudoviricetes sp.]